MKANKHSCLRELAEQHSGTYSEWYFEVWTPLPTKGNISGKNFPSYQPPAE